MPVKMKPTSTIKMMLGINSGGRVHRFLTKRSADRMDKYIPKGDTGFLRNNKTITPTYVLYKSPHAHYQYNGIIYVDPDLNAAGFLTDNGWKSRKNVAKVKTNRKLKHHTAGTGPKWDKAMLAKEKSKLVAEVQAYQRRGF